MANKYCGKCGCYVPVGETVCVSCGVSLYATGRIEKYVEPKNNTYSLDAAMQVISPNDNTTPPERVVEYKIEEVYDTIGRKVLSFDKTYTYPVKKIAIPKSPSPFCITNSYRLNETHVYIYAYTNDTNKMYIWANGQWVQIAS